MNSDLNFQLSRIADQFLPPLEWKSEPVTGGLINRSWKLSHPAGGNWLLQQINTRVFPNPEAIQRNYQLVQQSLNEAASLYQLPQLIPCRDGRLLVQLPDKSCWRMFEWVAHAVSYPEVADPEQSWMVARCFGRFVTDLQYAPVERFQWVLPGFHDLTLRVKQLDQAIAQNRVGRLTQCIPLLELMEPYRQLERRYRYFCEHPGAFRQYVLHHDTKISNILFHDQTGAVITPVDLDTTMPGYYFSDLGDMVRTLAPSVSEGHPEPDALEIRPLHYEALREGYLEQVSSLFTREELELIDYSGMILSYMQCVRFITDYLDGDRYYAIQSSEDNFRKARNQFNLLQRLEDFLERKYRIRPVRR